MTEPDPEKYCLHPSRSNWPIKNYDGRWYCSLAPGHQEDHAAFINHDPEQGVAWEGPWVPDDEVREQ